jgi:hypothetical protein
MVVLRSLAVLVCLTAASACGGTDELTPQERRQADARWELGSDQASSTAPVRRSV